MEITPNQRSVHELPTATSVATDPKALAESREVIQAVRAVNESEMLGQDNELTFRRDRQTHRMVIQVVNRKTGDVITQVPPEHVLRLADSLNTGAPHAHRR